MTKNFFNLFFIVLALSLAGCAKLAHLHELLTLKNYSNATAAQGRYLKAQDAKFDLMLAAARDGSLNQYKDCRKIQKTFGDPICIRSVKEGDVSNEEWLYRYAQKYFDSDKIYVNCDGRGRVVKWKLVLAPAKEASSNVSPNPQTSADHCGEAQ